jgi:hypothetical protein
MSQNAKNRNPFNNFLWYASGLNMRELSSSSKSNYFGIGGVNIFVTIFVLLLSSWAFHMAFPKTFEFIGLLIGLAISILSFTFNRQTINSLSHSDSQSENRKLSLTLFPIILFSIFFGIIISTPIKFYLFDIPLAKNFLGRITELDIISDKSISIKMSSWALTLFVILLVTFPTLLKFYTMRSGYQKRSSMLNEFMWFCSGANKDILRKCPNEYAKYFGMGGTILFTSLMASLSGGYAFYKAFDSSSLAICFGIFWGAMIFNLDRFIVNTMYSDGKPTISSKEFFSGLPRIVIAIFLGIVISFPLELKLFEDEIESRIEVLKVENLIAYDTISRKAFSEIESNKVEINGDEQKIDKLKTETSDAKVKWESIKQVPRIGTKPDEKGNIIRYTYYVWPPQYYTLKKDYEDIKGINDNDIANLKLKIGGKEQKIKAKETEKAGYHKANTQKIIAINDLSTRMEAFAKIKEEKPSIQIASLFIMLLLIIIEIAPVLFKMMLTSGEYETRQVTDSNLLKAEEIVRLSKKNDWANTEITKLLDENKKLIDEKQFELATELSSNQELLRAIAKAQSEIAQVAIEKWKEQEKLRALENPESFILSNKTGNQIT